ncbi:MAG: O-methyltransferase [Flavisolibacter sp.]
MYNSIQLATRYLQYYFTASNGKGHGMHSPFVFDFIQNVLNNKSNYNYPSEIEQLRKQLLHDERMIIQQDLGAGSRKKTSDQKTVAHLVKTALKPKKYAQLLYRLAKHYQPRTIVELGTSLGITTAYLSKADPTAEIITIEGNENIHVIAKDNFRKTGCENIEALIGNFDSVLPSVINHLSSHIGLAYIDGNHRYEPTMRYFTQFLSVISTESILVFDDIHWSVEMEKAWEEIKAHPGVQYTIDIFFLGFVFFRKEFKLKQDFIIRF